MSIQLVWIGMVSRWYALVFRVCTTTSRTHIVVSTHLMKLVVFGGWGVCVVIFICLRKALLLVLEKRSLGLSGFVE